MQKWQCLQRFGLAVQPCMFPDPGHTACMLQNSTRPTKGLPAPLAVELRIVVLRHYQTEMKLSEMIVF